MSSVAINLDDDNFFWAHWIFFIKFITNVYNFKSSSRNSNCVLEIAIDNFERLSIVYWAHLLKTYKIKLTQFISDNSLCINSQSKNKLIDQTYIPKFVNIIALFIPHLIHNDFFKVWFNVVQQYSPRIIGESCFAPKVTNVLLNVTCCYVCCSLQFLYSYKLYSNLFIDYINLNRQKLSNRFQTKYCK